LPKFSRHTLKALRCPELAEDVSENRIAIPAYIGAGQNGRENPARTGYASESLSAISGMSGHQVVRNALLWFLILPSILFFRESLIRQKR